MRRGSKRDDLLEGFTSGNDREERRQLFARLSRDSITYPTGHEEEFIHGCGRGVRWKIKKNGVTRWEALLRGGGMG